MVKENVTIIRFVPHGQIIELAQGLHNMMSSYLLIIIIDYINCLSIN